MSKKCWTARRSSETLGRFWLNGTLKIASSTAPHPLRSSFCTHSKGMWSNLGPMGSKVRNLWIEWMNGFTIQCWRIYPMLEAEKRTRSFNTSPIEKTKVQTFKISPIFENMVLGAELGTYCWRLQEWSQSSPPTSASRFPHQSPRPESKRRRKLDRNWCIILLKLPLAGGFCFHILTYPQMLESLRNAIFLLLNKLPKIFCWLAVYLGWILTPNFTQWLAFLRTCGNSYCPNTMSIHHFWWLKQLESVFDWWKALKCKYHVVFPFYCWFSWDLHPLQVQNRLPPPSDDNRSWHPRRDVSLGSKASSIMSFREGFGGYRILGN